MADDPWAKHIANAQAIIDDTESPFWTMDRYRVRQTIAALAEAVRDLVSELRKRDTEGR